MSSLKLEHVLSDNNYAFCCACEYGHLEVAKWLVDTFGLTINNVRSKDNFAFRLTCENGHLEVAKWLVDKFGLNIADVKSQNNYAFCSACENGHLNIMQFLIGSFELLEDDCTTSVNYHWTSLMKKAYKEENRFMVSWFVTKFPKNVILLNDTLLNDIFEDCKEFVLQDKVSNEKNMSSLLSMRNVMHETLCCTICFELFKEPVTLTSCGHNFCNVCITDWIQRNATCAICRQHCQLHNLIPSFTIKEMVDALKI